MKASDFTTGGNDREKAMSNLLKTEKTDAVNTGLVEKADKSAKALRVTSIPSARRARTAREVPPSMPSQGNVRRLPPPMPLTENPVAS